MYLIYNCLVLLKFLIYLKNKIETSQKPYYADN